VRADRLQVSNRGGHAPLWSRDGRELFFLEGSPTPRLVTVPVDIPGSGVLPALGSRRALFDWPYRLSLAGRVGRSYDVSLDGRRVLAVKPGAEARELIVVQNWFSELQRSPTVAVVHHRK
jgi:hypothetical protein